MKVKIIIEQFDNGITLKWQGPDHDSKAIVAHFYDREKAIGEMILNDVKHIMDAESCNVVTMEIEYGNGDTNQVVGEDSECGPLG